jgi:hypothetical protein
MGREKKEEKNRKMRDGNLAFCSYLIKQVLMLL